MTLANFLFLHVLRDVKEIQGKTPKTGDLFSLHLNFMVLHPSIPPVPPPPPHPRATLGVNARCPVH